MTLGILNLIIWIPFILVTLVTFILTGISGFKKGLWRALISLGGVLVATIVSILSSSLLSKLLAPSVVSYTLQYFPTEDIPATLIDTIATMVIGCVLSVVLFGLFMIVFSIVFHIIGMTVKSDRLNVSTKGLKWAGLGVGLATSLLFALIFLSPAYSTIGTAAGIVSQFANFASGGLGGSSDIGAFSTPVTSENAIDLLKDHALVKASTNGPLTLVNNNVVQLDVGGESLSIPAIMDTFEQLGKKIEIIANADEEEIQPLCEDFIKTLKNDIVHTGWSYAAFNMGVDFLKDFVDENIPEEIASQIDLSPFFEQLELSREEFFINCDSLLEFMQYALEHNILEYFEEENVDMLYGEGILAEAGKLANVSEQSIFVKKILLAGAVSDIFDGDFIKGLAFIEKASIGQITNPDEQLAEAESLFIIIGLVSGSPEEAILRHPYLGEESLKGLSAMGATIGTSSDPETADFIANNPDLQKAIFDSMVELSDKPLGESSNHLGAAIETLFSFTVEDGYYFYLNTDVATAQKALSLLGKKRFASSSIATGQESYDLMDKSLKALAKYEQDSFECINTIQEINRLMVLAQESSAYKLYEYDWILRNILTAVMDSPADKYLFEQLNKNGANPMKLTISHDVKQAMSDVLSSIRNSMLVSEGDEKYFSGFSYYEFSGDSEFPVYSTPVEPSISGEGNYVFYSGGGSSTATFTNGKYSVIVSDEVSIQDIFDGYTVERYTKEEADEYNAQIDYGVNLIATFLGI